MNEVLFIEDQKKIEDAVMYYPMGSYQIGEIARLSSLLYERGVNVIDELNKLHYKYGISDNE